MGTYCSAYRQEQRPLLQPCCGVCSTSPSMPRCRRSASRRSVLRSEPSLAKARGCMHELLKLIHLLLRSKTAWKTWKKCWPLWGEQKSSSLPPCLGTSYPVAAKTLSMSQTAWTRRRISRRRKMPARSSSNRRKNQFGKDNKHTRFFLVLASLYLRIWPPSTGRASGRAMGYIWPPTPAGSPPESWWRTWPAAARRASQ